MLTLFTDTDTDITPEVAKEYGYHLISIKNILYRSSLFHIFFILGANTLIFVDNLLI